MEDKYVEMSEILKAMAHPVRLRLLKGLMANECNVGKIVDKLNLPQSTVSQHLGVLRTRGIITPKKYGVKTCYQVIDKRVKDILEVMEK